MIEIYKNSTNRIFTSSLIIIYIGNHLHTLFIFKKMQLPIIKAYTLNKTNQEPIQAPSHNNTKRYIIPRRSHKSVTHYSLKFTLTCSEGLPNDQYSKLTEIMSRYQPPTQLEALEKTKRKLSKSTLSLQKCQQDFTINKKKSAILQEEIIHKIQTYRDIIGKAPLLFTGERNRNTIIQPTQMQRLKSLIRSKSTSNAFNKSAQSYRLNSKFAAAADQNQNEIESIFQNCRKTFLEQPIESKAQHQFNVTINTFNDICQIDKSSTACLNAIVPEDISAGISSKLQRKVFLYPNICKYPITVYCNFDHSSLSQEDLTKLLKLNRENNRSIYLDMVKYESNPKSYASIIKCLGSSHKTEYDASTIESTSLDLSNSVQLYCLLLNAAQPNMYSVSCNEINSIDTFQADWAIKEITENGLTYSAPDTQAIQSYDQILCDIPAGKVIVGFWVNKRVFLSSPTLRTHGVCVSDGDIAYVFGGLSTHRKNDLWIIQPSGDAYEWKSLPSKGAPVERYGSCGCIYKSIIYIALGCGEYLKHLNSRLSFNDVNSYNINTGVWKKNIETKGESTQRRSFAAFCLMDNGLFIHGGYSGSNRTSFNSMSLLNLGKQLIRYTYVVRSNSKSKRRA